MSRLEHLLANIASGPLYHYTDQNGIFGIANTRSIWASSIFHLNDSAEYQHAVDMITEILREKLRGERGPYNEHYGFLLEHIPWFAEFDVCVASFSEHPDLLSQWRRYCAGGLGFCIGFNPQFLASNATKQSFIFRRCIYQTDIQRSICQEILQKSCQAAHNIEEAKARDAALWNEFVKWMRMIFPALKHPCFREEK